MYHISRVYETYQVNQSLSELWRDFDCDVCGEHEMSMLVYFFTASFTHDTNSVRGRKDGGHVPCKHKPAR